MPKVESFPRWMMEFVSRKWGRNFARAVYTPLDKAVYRLTGGRRGLSPARTVLYLTTTGRKTGKPRRVPVLFLRDGERYWVMASNYGTERHPAWSGQLAGNPGRDGAVGLEDGRGPSASRFPRGEGTAMASAPRALSRVEAVLRMDRSRLPTVLPGAPR